ncbi:MAG: TlpA family protein disulfide reductase [Mycobacterium leprae]
MKWTQAKRWVMAFACIGVVLFLLSQAPRLQARSSYTSSGISGIAMATERSPGIKPGSPVPQTDLVDLAGNPVPLLGKQKTVLLFIRTTCSASKQQLTHLQGWVSRNPGYAKKFDLRVVSPEKLDLLRPFGQEYSFPVYQDPSAMLEDQLGVNGSPFLFLVDNDGRVILRWAGAVETDDGNLMDTLLEMLLDGAY